MATAETSHPAADAPAEPLAAASSAAAIHVRVSLVLLLILCGVCLGVDLCAHSSRVAAWLDDRTLVDHQAHNRPFVRTHNYGDFFDWLMLDEVPNADYSRGGVYFMGSSNIVFCAEFGDLPPQQQRLIHNYGFPGADPTEILHFVRYLVEHDGMLAAGPRKTTIVLCLTQNDVVDSTPLALGAGGFFPHYLNQSGFYNYDPDRGITAVPMSGWERALRMRRARARSFAQRCQQMMKRSTRPQIDPVALRVESERTGGGEWSQSRTHEMDQLERLLDYLQAKDVHVEFLMLPVGSWDRGGLPFHRMFVSQVKSLCAARQIHLLDRIDLLRDDEFMDPHHATFEGAIKIREELVRLAMDRLRDSGVLPADGQGVRDAH